MKIIKNRCSICNQKILGKPAYKNKKKVCSLCYGKIKISEKPQYYYRGYAVYCDMRNMLSCPELELLKYKKASELIEDIKIVTGNKQKWIMLKEGQK